MYGVINRCHSFIIIDSEKFVFIDSIIHFDRHDVAQTAGFIAISFGMEDVDRYIVVYKKDCVPSEDEVSARRNGEEWNAETAKKYEQKVNELRMKRNS